MRIAEKRCRRSSKAPGGMVTPVARKWSALQGKRSSSMGSDQRSAAASSTFTASTVTSTPMPSPGSTAMRCGRRSRGCGRAGCDGGMAGGDATRQPPVAGAGRGSRKPRGGCNTQVSAEFRFLPQRRMSTCAKCGFALSDAAVECPACGIVLGKLRSDRSRQPSAAALPATAQPTTKGAAGVRRLVAAILPPIPPPLRPQSRRAANAFATSELLRRVARQARRVPLLVRLLRIQAALAAVLVGFALLRVMFWRSYLLQSLGEGLDLSALAELDSFVLGTRVLLEGVVVVCWLVWQRLAYDNLRAIGAKDSRFSSRAGLVYWFVPLFNLFRPYQVVHDLLVRSRSSNSLSAGDTAAARVPLLDVWWGSSIALFFSLQPTRRPHALRPEAQLPAIVLEATALIVAALAAARVVIEVDRAQRLWLEPVTQPVPLPRSEALP